MTIEQFPRIGDRVFLVGKHPHAGESGTVVRQEVLGMFPHWGPRPVIELDDGSECFITDRDHWKPERRKS